MNRKMKFLLATDEYTKKELEKAGAKVLSNQSGYCVLSNTLNSEQMAEFAKDRNMNFSYSNIMFL